MARPRQAWYWVLLWGLVLVWSLSASAEETTIDSVSTDSTAGSLSPRGALWRSALLPGWGQFHNDRPFKGVFFGGLASGFLVATATEIDRLGKAQSPVEKEDRAAQRNTLILLFVATATFAGLDAYVDAHLAGFKVEPIAVQSGLGVGIALSRRGIWR